MTSYIAQRRFEEKERRRAEILDAAEALYLDAGWDATTIDEVARRARLSRALVYVYFKDKRDLHFGIVDRALRELHARFEAAVAEHAQGLAKVEAIGRAYVAYARELPHYFDACNRFQAHRPDDTDGEMNEAVALDAAARVHGVLVDAIQTGIEDGTIRNDIEEPLMTATVLWGFTHGIIQIASSKDRQFAALGIETPALMAHSFQLLRASLAKAK